MPLADDLPALLSRLDAHIDAIVARSRRVSRIRLATALVGLGVAIALGQTVGRGAGWLAALAALVVFAVLVTIHERIESALSRARLWRALRARDGARVARNWDGLGPAPAPAAPGHAYAADLDVVGPRSVLHLLDTTGTVAGQSRLRDLLLTTTDGAETRQARVQALVPRRRFRHRLALLAHTAAGGADHRWDDAPAQAWLAAEPVDGLRRWAVVLSALAVATVVFAGLDLAGGPALWIYSFALYAVLYLWKYASVKSVFAQGYDLQKALGEIADVLRFLEADPAGRDPALAALWASFRDGASPTRRLERLQRIVTAASLSRNDVGGVILNAALPYDLLLTLALDRIRDELAGLFGPWLETLAEVEALGALAGYADREPDAVVFPTLLPDAPDAPLLDAADLRHPLLADAVGNDVVLAEGEVMVLTGSNMSGKSTFLRSVGLASVLGNAGGPVPAAALSLRTLRPAASMRIGDALTEGMSTFYAEVRRLRAVLDTVEAPGPPALVLIDEMLRGTNNRERLAGAQGVVRALVGDRAASLVATHDLALADLAAESPQIRNAHFRETAEGDRLVFDYLLRPGPCPTTNALVIMRNAGLPVGEPAALGSTQAAEPSPQSVGADPNPPVPTGEVVASISGPEESVDETTR